MKERTPANLLEQTGFTMGEYNRWKREHPIKYVQIKVKGYLVGRKIEKRTKK